MSVDELDQLLPLMIPYMQPTLHKTSKTLLSLCRRVCHAPQNRHRIFTQSPNVTPICLYEGDCAWSHHKICDHRAFKGLKRHAPMKSNSQAFQCSVAVACDAAANIVALFSIDLQAFEKDSRRPVDFALTTTHSSEPHAAKTAQKKHAQHVQEIPARTIADSNAQISSTSLKPHTRSTPSSTAATPPSLATLLSSPLAVAGWLVRRTAAHPL